MAGAGFDATLNFTATTTLDATFTGIRNLVTGNTGGTTIAGAISTTGVQTYNDAVTLSTGAITLTSTGVGSAGDIHFVSTLAGGGQTLSLVSQGSVAFGAAVTALQSHTDGRHTVINGGLSPPQPLAKLTAIALPWARIPR